ncbi:Protein of unknown function [Variovorax sp. OK605]|uniref:YgaP family membrane protein n=1 Tax=Variovorax sp. OK605 TaxID=1855317 RepID=UPI0008EFD839|nr:DUF2892 domain-containing protein [Variovorax sp. OK605]SFQ59801.1 Protein of unknown function [Variovorax sp. OK605]
MGFLSNNVGAADRTLRIGVGALLILLAGMGYVGWWGYLGLIPLLTGAMGSCPLYSLFGFSSCPRSGH